MVAHDEDALVCDFAEEYHIYNYKELPVKTRATLAAGLRNDSRIKLKMSGMNYPLEVILLARCADELAILAWQNTEDGHKGKNRPKLIVPSLLKSEEKSEKDVVAFQSVEEFEAARARYIKD